MNRFIIYGTLCLLILCLLSGLLFGILVEDDDAREENVLTEKLLHGIGVRYWFVDIPHAPVKINFHSHPIGKEKVER